MTESTDPLSMFYLMRGTGRGSIRKLRLLVAALCRVWNPRLDESALRMVEMMEALADKRTNWAMSQLTTVAAATGLVRKDPMWDAVSLLLECSLTTHPGPLKEGSYEEDVTAPLHDIFGPLPFRPLSTIAPSLLVWN